ncbi:hypothetical protein GCM10009678_66430 [Actinomadura kijaniata]|uniref:Uncharacterized protein n=1 Tax=Actinomadura namibiensis TaxID=182080 RepID=A0A7W3QR85_ACTNM|nr:hypothetical protein [Actinomadura namibiensis]MBA8956545.1 hypothetical protein [Actinomadura namibiensis]
MSSNGDSPHTQQISNAKQALTAYERASLLDPDNTPHPQDPDYLRDVLSALLCDLEHLATVHGVDFAQAVATGHRIHADEVAAARIYEVGDQVQIRLIPNRRGTVIEIDEAHGESLYLVKVPGLPYLHQERAVSLEPAPPFPPVEGVDPPVTTAVQAEAALVEAAAHMRPGSPMYSKYQGQTNRLLEALSDWSGTRPNELLQDLSSKISRRGAELERPARPTGNPARLAARDFPLDITEGFPADPTSPAAPSRPQRHQDAAHPPERGPSA